MQQHSHFDRLLHFSSSNLEVLVLYALESVFNSLLGHKWHILHVFAYHEFLVVVEVLDHTSGHAVVEVLGDCLYSEELVVGSIFCVFVLFVPVDSPRLVVSESPLPHNPTLYFIGAQPIIVFLVKQRSDGVQSGLASLKCNFPCSTIFQLVASSAILIKVLSRESFFF